MKAETLDDLCLHTLKDVLYAERKMHEAQPQMQSMISDPEPNHAPLPQSKGTSEQFARLEEIFASLGKLAKAKKYGPMVGLIEEAEALMIEIGAPGSKDAALTSLAQAVEHYEIALRHADGAGNASSSGNGSAHESGA
ncbi:DUF892 family protein [Roseovarius sp. D0-M9]|uniref:DUF892 family protein n=1 Tax=Roseovarius sp. D0-M9 TaxID=3127117 RepID=UPI00301044E2